MLIQIKKSAYDKATNAVSNIISVENGTVNKSKGTYADQATVEQLTKDENDAWNKLNGVKPKDNEVNSPVGGTITIEKGHTLDSTDAANAISNKDSLTNVKVILGMVLQIQVSQELLLQVQK